jgi:hypothetical protein
MEHSDGFSAVPPGRPRYGKIPGIGTPGLISNGPPALLQRRRIAEDDSAREGEAPAEPGAT